MKTLLLHLLEPVILVILEHKVLKELQEPKGFKVFKASKVHKEPLL
jgi:hypothetical protein